MRFHLIEVVLGIAAAFFVQAIVSDPWAALPLDGSAAEPGGAIAVGAVIGGLAVGHVLTGTSTPQRPRRSGGVVLAGSNTVLSVLVGPPA